MLGAAAAEDCGRAENNLITFANLYGREGAGARRKKETNGRLFSRGSSEVGQSRQRCLMREAIRSQRHRQDARAASAAVCPSAAETAPKAASGSAAQACAAGLLPCLMLCRLPPRLPCIRQEYVQIVFVQDQTPSPTAWANSTTSCALHRRAVFMSSSGPTPSESAGIASTSADSSAVAKADATGADAVAQLRAASFEFAHLLRPAEGGAIRTEAQRLGSNLENTITRLDEFSALMESVSCCML
jgi:hypothetical protein